VVYIKKTTLKETSKLEFFFVWRISSFSSQILFKYKDIKNIKLTLSGVFCYL